jgi:hypothetical protein
MDEHGLLDMAMDAHPHAPALKRRFRHILLLPRYALIIHDHMID